MRDPMNLHDMRDPMNLHDLTFHITIANTREELAAQQAERPERRALALLRRRSARAGESSRPKVGRVQT